MPDFVVALLAWLHVLATIVMVGYFFLTCLIYLPAFEQQMEPATLGQLLEHTSARLRPYFGASLLIFLVTDTRLLLINENYLGLGNVFGNLSPQLTEPIKPPALARGSEPLSYRQEMFGLDPAAGYKVFLGKP